MLSSVCDVLLCVRGVCKTTGRQACVVNVGCEL